MQVVILNLDDTKNKYFEQISAETVETKMVLIYLVFLFLFFVIASKLLVRDDSACSRKFTITLKI